MNKILGIAAVLIMVSVPVLASAHTHPVSCTIPAAPTGGGLVYGSSPMAPGWNVNLPDGGQGGSIFMPFNGTTCPFNQGCMLPK